MIYLDYNATTPIAEPVRQAMLPFLAEQYGNPSSSHALGRAAARAVEQARGQVAKLLGCQTNEVIFTGGGTESNNMAIQGALFQHTPPLKSDVPRGHLVISAIEHPATTAPAKFLESLGYEVSIVGCDDQGVINPVEVAATLRSDTVLVSIMHANNEVGAMEPVAEIASICKARGVLCHTDAAQSVGKVSTRVDTLGVDMLSIAGHKMYAPKGVGALFVRQGVELEPVLHGAGHEQGRRPGTENVPYIVALGRAAELMFEGQQEATQRMRSLRDRLEENIREGIGSPATVNAGQTARLPNTLSINFPGVNGAELLARCPDLCASTGAACHSGDSSLSATLRAMGLPEEVARGTVRLSVGRATSEEEVEQAAAMLVDAWRALS